MTYEEIVEICDAVFEEYLPEVKKKARRTFIDELLTELEFNEVLTVTPEAALDTDQDFLDSIEE